jgi:hypothetical protein
MPIAVQVYASTSAPTSSMITGPDVVATQSSTETARNAADALDDDITCSVAQYDGSGSSWAYSKTQARLDQCSMQPDRET